MTDKYKDLRDALAAGPTPGPWTVRYDYVVQATSFDGGRLVPVAQPYGVNSDGTDLFANARMIAAANPETIRALLSDYDRLRAAAKQVDALYPNVWDLVDGGLFIMPENVKRFDDAFDALRAALAQHQGEKHGDQ